MGEDERKLKEGHLAALRAGVEAGVQEAISQCVARAVASGAVGAHEALEAAVEAACGMAVARLAVERARAGGGGDATAGAIGETEGLAVAAVQAKAGELMRGLEVVVDG